MEPGCEGAGDALDEPGYFLQDAHFYINRGFPLPHTTLTLHRPRAMRPWTPTGRVSCLPYQRGMSHHHRISNRAPQSPIQQEGRRTSRSVCQNALKILRVKLCSGRDRGRVIAVGTACFEAV